MVVNEQSLRGKGWSEKEIQEAKEITTRAHLHKHSSHIHWQRAMYWLLFVLIVVGAAIGVWLVEPFLFIFSPMAVNGISFVFGLLIGGLLWTVIRDFDLLHHHHGALGAILVLISIATSFLLFHRVSQLTNIFPQLAMHAPLIIGLCFSAGSLGIYSFMLLRRWYFHGFI